MQRRLLEHEQGTAPDSYTATKRPLEIGFVQMFNDVRQAIAFEKQVKGWLRKKKEAIIQDNWDNLPEFARCKAETSHLNFERDKNMHRTTPFDSAQGDSHH